MSALTAPAARRSAFAGLPRIAVRTRTSENQMAMFSVVSVGAIAFMMLLPSPRGHGFGPDWRIIRSLFRFGLPTGIQGIAMNVGGVLMLAFIGSLPQSAAAQAAFAISYTQLFSLITWTSVGLMGAAAAVAGQNLGAINLSSHAVRMTRNEMRERVVPRLFEIRDEIRQAFI